MKVGFIGLGIMGKPMCKNLMKAGYEMVVTTHNKETLKEMEALGATNYSCVWIGVFLDYKMPRTPNSTNELLHGNISKVLVLFVSIALTVWEIYFSTFHAGIIIDTSIFSSCINHSSQ